MMQIGEKDELRQGRGDKREGEAVSRVHPTPEEVAPAPRP